MTSHCLQEDNEREVMVRQSPVKIKEIYISDKTTEKVKVTLWRSTNLEAKIGDFVKITNVVTNNFKGFTSLSSTGDSTLLVSIYFTLYRFLVK